MLYCPWAENRMTYFQLSYYAGMPRMLGAQGMRQVKTVVSEVERTQVREQAPGAVGRDW